MWYCRHEIQLRQALFFSAASIAGAFSGLLAFAISKMDGVAGLHGWQWIFILEGIVTVLVAISAYFLIHDFPDTASFLTEEERAYVIYRLKYQGQAKLGRIGGTVDAENGGSHLHGHAQVEQAEEFQWDYVWQAFKDWQIYVHLFVYWGIVCPLYGISLFLPTIIKSLNYSKTEAQLMTVPIYITAAVLAVIVAFFSDRVGKRSPFVISFMFVMVIGFTMFVPPLPLKPLHGGAKDENANDWQLLGASRRATPRLSMVASSSPLVPFTLLSQVSSPGYPITCREVTSEAPAWLSTSVLVTWVV